MNYYTSLFKGIIEKRKLIWDLAKADFKKRFVGSYFGVVWMFVQPLVTILIYAFLFGEYGFKSPPPVPGASYVIWMVPGIVPWFYFSEALNSGTNCLQEYHYLVKKVVFQVEMLPIIKLISLWYTPAFWQLWWAFTWWEAISPSRPGFRYCTTPLQCPCWPWQLPILRALSRYFLKIWLRLWESACSLACG